MRNLATFIVDSFTSEPFKGNPAGVCWPATELTDLQMSSIAAELGLSETAFLLPLATAGTFSIRYFSPRMEIPLCGHATLAAAKVLFEDFHGDQLKFVNADGLELGVKKVGDKLTMKFPEYSTSPAEVPKATLDALGIEAVSNCEFNQETGILLLQVQSSLHVQAIAPDVAALIRSHDAVNGVVVTAPFETDEFDFCSRYFWPWSGTSEDPVTGGTHTFLARYWGDRLGKSKMRAVQLSQRTGSMEVELIADSNGQRSVLITGSAVIFLKGEIVI